MDQPATPIMEQKIWPSCESCQTSPCSLPAILSKPNCSPLRPLNEPALCYLRLGKAGEPIIHTSQPDITIGKAIVLREGEAGTLISTGAMLGMTMKAADELAALGISVSVLSMPSLAPLDKDAVLRAARDTGRILTVENHGLGGLGSAVAEVLVASPLHPRFAAMYLQATPIKVAGSEASMYATHNLSAAEITSKMKSLIVA